MSATFLEAEWRKLAMASYAVDPGLLEAYLPYKTELDYWNNTCYVSLVGFMFLNTKIRGLRIPFHVNFGEINLRFYVKYAEQGVWKRGVVFVKEIVPRRALSLVANVLYKEKYETMPVRHLWQLQEDHWDITYKWGKGLGNALQVTAGKEPEPITAGSKEAFITEHYWGYTKVADRKTAQYEVAHPRWEVYPVKNYTIDVDFGKIYGPGFAFLKEEQPSSVFLAEGSPITVKKSTTL